MNEPGNRRMNPIVPDRDAMIGGSGPAKSHQRNPGMHQNGGDGSGLGRGWKFLFLVGFSTLGLGAFGGWLEFSSLKASHDTLRQRFDEVESRLSSTDESVSQSGAALQVKLSRQQDELDEHWSEIKKLWGVSNDINKGKIEKNKNDIVFLAQKRVELEQLAADLKTAMENREKRITAVNVKSLELSEDIATLHQQLRDMDDDARKISELINRLERQLKSHSEAIDSMDGFRRQINQKLFRLEQTSVSE